MSSYCKRENYILKLNKRVSGGDNDKDKDKEKEKEKGIV